MPTWQQQRVSAEKFLGMSSPPAPLQVLQIWKYAREVPMESSPVAIPEHPGDWRLKSGCRETLWH